jgi:DNA polymerase I-like protein with 3'-5' exonuclease and polymerase domains
MQIKPATQEAVLLFDEGIEALSQMEHNGIRVDYEYLDKAVTKTDKKLRRLEQELRESDEFVIWKKRFGDKTKLGAHRQLGTVVFGEKDFKGLGYKRGRQKKRKNYDTHEKDLVDANDRAAFEHLDVPFIHTWFEYQNYYKLRWTYIESIIRELEGEKLHPFFDLHNQRAYRGTSSKINFQNLPVRNAEIAKLVRSCIIPPDGYVIGENDFSGIEVCIGACYHKDPKMIEYIESGYDYHKEYAAKVYLLQHMLKHPDWWKDKDGGRNIRYCGKNKFVFPQFYGSYFADCAPSLWEGITVMDLKVDGMTLHKHLAKKGIKELGDCEGEPDKGTFEYHVKKVEEELWDLFHVYDEWKQRFIKLYRKRGYFQYHTGFVASGLYRNNEVTNIPIQGSAFHCLLWVLIQLQKWLNKYRMKTKLVGQIHDSIISYIHMKERDDYLAQIKYLAQVALPKHWPWIIVPMKIEAEIAPEGKSWHHKKEVKI